MIVDLTFKCQSRRLVKESFLREVEDKELEGEKRHQVGWVKRRQPEGAQGVRNGRVVHSDSSPLS